MSEDIRSTGIWQDALEMPEALQTTLDDSEGFADVASLLRRNGTGASLRAATELPTTLPKRSGSRRSRARGLRWR